MPKIIVHRSKSLRIAALAIWALAILFYVTSIEGSSIVEFSVGLGVLLFVSFLLYRTAQSSVTADEHGVAVRNAFSAHHFDWCEVDEFRTGGGFLDFRAFGSPATLWLADGRKQYVTAIQPTFLIDGGGSSNVQTCRELNEMRERYEPS